MTDPQRIRRYRVVRHDDNGNEVIVGERLDWNAANETADSLARRGHKQWYEVKEDD